MTELLNPFSTVPSPRYLYLAPQYRAVVNHAVEVVTQRQGLAILSGPVGSGKSTLIRYLLDVLADELEDELRIIYVNNPTFTSPFQMIRSLCHEVDLPPKATRHEQTELFREWLVAQYKDGKNVLVVVDEAHRLSGPMLELLREFFNYSTNDTFLCQVLIAGETAPLTQRLKLKKAITSRALYYDNLDPLNEGEVADMLSFRLRVAGATESLFTLGAVASIHRLTKGNPRDVVRLCRKLFNEALQGGWKEITATEVKLHTDLDARKEAAHV